MADPTVVRELHARVVDQFSGWRESEEAAGRTPELDDQRAYAAALIEAELSRHARAQVDAGSPLPDGEQEQELSRTLQALLFGLGPLEALLADPEIENIDYNGCDAGWLQYADGTIKPAPALWTSDSALVSFIQTVGARQGHAPRRFDLGQPRLNLRLPDGSRLFALMDVSHRPCLSIRRHRLVCWYSRVIESRVFLGWSLRLMTAPVVARGFRPAAGRGGGRSRPPRAGWAHRACAGCARRGRWPSWH